MVKRYNFFKTGNLIQFADIDPETIIETLDPAVYTIAIVNENPALVKYADNFTLPETIFGARTNNNLKMIGRLYGKTEAPMGVLTVAIYGNINNVI